jgi:hypothetical protein
MDDGSLTVKGLVLGGGKVLAIDRIEFLAENTMVGL